jgi:hypothetical protein
MGRGNLVAARRLYVAITQIVAKNDDEVGRAPGAASPQGARHGLAGEQCRGRPEKLTTIHHMVPQKAPGFT